MFHLTTTNMMLMLMSLACASLVALSSGAAAGGEKCRAVRETMMSCLNANEEDLPKASHPKVEWLTLTKSHVPNIKSSQLKNFPKLTDFHAENAGIERIEDNAFKSVQILNWVDVSSNKIKSVHVDLVKGLTNIEHFNISGNPGLMIPERKNFLVSEKLKWLDLSSCDIKQVYSESFQKLPALRDLSLARNKLTNLPHDIFQKTTGILSFDITGNQIKHLSDKVFLNLRTMVARFEGNPWECNCDLAPLLIWSKRNVVKGDVACTKPKDKKWKDITEPNQLCKPLK